MSQSNEILEPRLVAVDSYHLSFINDMVQTLSSNSERLSMALNTIIADDDASKGVITAIQGALFHDSQSASDISEMLDQLIVMPPVEVTSHE
ncbi:hypothetical protein [uncultured Psychrobacter sp.]|uniref:hypothetical protein n=1 Tax=uncultured Psychrobacter sp. TaxID=259303 RepID=UPI00262A5D48|nr:hypothetical protein [uncultured Psychrobacter sp.]